MLSFSTLEDKLLKGEKTQTIRANAEYWEDHYIRYLKYCQDVGLPNVENKFRYGLHNHFAPRTRGGYKMGVAVEWKLSIIQGHDIDWKIARLDGFPDLKTLWSALFRLSPFAKHWDFYEWCYDHEWAVITWDWHYGPYLPDQWWFFERMRLHETFRAYKAKEINWKYQRDQVHNWRE